MAANIPYQIVWNAKHGKSPEVQQPIQQQMRPDQNISNFPITVPHAGMQNAMNVAQPFELLFTGLDDMTLFEGMNDTDFTDMLLDWQSLRGSIPGWA